MSQWGSSSQPSLKTRCNEQLNQSTEGVEPGKSRGDVPTWKAESPERVLLPRPPTKIPPPIYRDKKNRPQNSSRLRARPAHLSGKECNRKEQSPLNGATPTKRLEKEEEEDNTAALKPKKNEVEHYSEAEKERYSTSVGGYRRNN